MGGVSRRVPTDRLPSLVAAAAEAFIEHGFERTQMEDIAARLGVAKGTIYRSVPSKEALFAAVLVYADAPASLPETGVLEPIGFGASAFAGARPASRALTGHTVAITRLGRTVASVTAGASRDISVLDAGTIGLTIDGTTATFRVDTIVPVAGWTVEVSVRDGSHAAVVFTMGIRRVEVSLVLDDRVLVTITEVPQGPTSSTTATPPPSSSTSTSTVATTTPTTVASTAVPSTTASTVALVACQSSREGDDDKQGDDDEQGDDGCDDDEEQRTTTQTSIKASTKHDDDDHDDHEEKRGDKHESHDD